MTTSHAPGSRPCWANVHWLFMIIYDARHTTYSTRTVIHCRRCLRRERIIQAVIVAGVFIVMMMPAVIIFLREVLREGGLP